MQIEYTKNGRRTNVNAKVAKVLISRGLARPIEDDQSYLTRDLQAAIADSYAGKVEAAESVDALFDEAAPYGYKADGTPRKRPGRPVSAKEE